MRGPCPVPSGCPGFSAILYVAERPGRRLGYLAIYILILPYLGYHLATPILTTVILLTLGVSWLMALVFGTFMSLFVAFFFEVSLNVVLPVGIFGLALPF